MNMILDHLKKVAKSATNKRDIIMAIMQFKKFEKL